MQLEQAGFRVSRFILTPIPKFLLLVAAFIILIIITINAFLMYTTKPVFHFRSCLQRYYDLTHPNMSQYIQNAIQNNKTGIAPQDTNLLFKYVNASTLLKFQTSRELQSGNQCIIQLNYNPLQTKTIQQNGIQVPAYQTLGYMMSNYPLINLNITNKQLISKHNISLNRIILPPIEPGFRYFGMNVFTNKIQDFLYGIQEEFEEVNKYVINKWTKHMGELVRELKKESQKQNQKAKEKEKLTNASKQQANKPQQTTKQEAQNKITPKQSTNSLASNSITKQEHKISTGDISQSQNSTAKAQTNTTKQQNPLKILQKKYMIAANAVMTSNSKTIYSKHKMMYRLDGTVKWQSVQFQSYPKELNRNIVISMIGKFIFLMVFLSVMVIIVFPIIGMFVRYSFIVIMTIVAILGGKNMRKSMGWLHRYTDLIEKTEQRKYQSKKIVCQVGFSIIAMHTLYALMAYFLITTCQMAVMNLYMIPSNPHYATKIFTTFIIIEIFHYIFFRTRISLFFFHKFSFCSTIFTILIVSYYPFFLTSAILNAHFLINLFLILCFLYIEKLVSQEEFESGHRPSLEKPRMLFYFGYDLDWHKSIPPFWTQFQIWYDLSFANDQERSYIDQNYELLYGRLMGVNQPQQLPDEDNDSDQSASFKHVQMQEITQ